MAVVTTDKPKLSKSEKNTPVTVVELKSWLEGVEDMQGPAWVPNKEQWKKIRNKIQLLIDTPNGMNRPEQNHSYVQSGLQSALVPVSGIAPAYIQPAAPPTLPELSTELGAITEQGDYASPYI